jgi:hypothetical protein
MAHAFCEGFGHPWRITSSALSPHHLVSRQCPSLVLRVEDIQFKRAVWQMSALDDVVKSKLVPKVSGELRLGGALLPD